MKRILIYNYVVREEFISNKDSGVQEQNWPKHWESSAGYPRFEH